MGKSELTINIENALSSTIATGMNQNIKCAEVSIDNDKNGSKHRFVDFLRYDRLKDNFICYEIKISKSDFNSKNGHNFVGNRNYYVIPYELLDYVKAKITGTDIGIITYTNYCMISKHCKTLEITNERKMLLMTNLAKALQRENRKLNWRR